MTKDEYLARARLCHELGDWRGFRFARRASWRWLFLWAGMPA